MGEPKHIRDVVPQPVDALFTACDESKGVNACPWCGSKKHRTFVSGTVHVGGKPVERSCFLGGYHPWHDARWGVREERPQASQDRA